MKYVIYDNVKDQCLDENGNHTFKLANIKIYDKDPGGDEKILIFKEDYFKNVDLNYLDREIDKIVDEYEEEEDTPYEERDPYGCSLYQNLEAIAECMLKEYDFNGDPECDVSSMYHSLLAAMSEFDLNKLQEFFRQ